MFGSSALALLVCALCAVSGLPNAHLSNPRTQLTSASESCTFTVDGHKYDLSSVDSAWFPAATGTIWLGPCRVNPPADNCAPGCMAYQVDNHGDCWCLGKLDSATTSAGTDTFFVKYDGGVRPNTDPPQHNLLSIEFQCGRADVPPFDVVENPPLTYSVKWTTPAACNTPRAPCHVQVDGSTYDLSSLGTAQFSFTTGDFSVSLCDAAKPAERCDDGCAAYQIDIDNNCWCLGRKDSLQTFGTENGFQLAYSNGSNRTNPANGTNSLLLTVACSEKAAIPSDVIEQPLFTYRMVWLSPAACTPLPPSSCQAQVDGKAFPLSTLTTAQFVDDGAQYWMNPCGVPRPSWQCDADKCAGYKINADDSCECLGQASNVTWASYGDGSIEGQFGNGQQRRQGSDSLGLVLECARTEAKPTEVVTNAGHEYKAKWSTPLVC